MPEPSESFYDLLEVTANASFDEIADAYLRISAYLGPESLAMYSMLAEDDIADMRQRVERAYHTLSDPALRAAYDDELTGAPRDGGYPAVMVPRADHGADVTYGRVEHRDVEVAPTSRTPSKSDEEVAVASGPEAERDESTVAGQGDELESASVATESETERETAPERETASETDAATEPAHRAPDPETVEVPKTQTPAQAPPPVPARPILSSELRERSVPAGSRGFSPPEHLLNLSAEPEISGSTLKRLRTACGASINEVAEITKVSKRYLKALEENDFGELPAPVYVRGFVREYARTFGVDPDVVAASYMALYRRYREGE